MKLTNKSMIRSQRFFNKVSSHYQDLIAKRGTPNQINVHQAIVEPRIGERALDVGNGGERRFYPPQTSFYVGVDFNLEMLKRGENSTYYKVCAEAIDLPFKEGGFDTILYFYLLHHLAQGSIGATNEAVKKALREGSICLKTGGNVIIAETCVPSFLEKVERAFFFILRVFLFFTKQSEVFFFSAETLTRILTECGYREIRTWKVSDEEKNPWKWVRISIGLPNLKIPRWMNPSRITIFEARN
jgi:ubiquinone/menaquinone biosynthesis C-methylase UbiE